LRSSILKKRTVLRLIYDTAVFGPIHLEYEAPVIRVGRSEDNDLVLRHPSVERYHCLLVFRGEKVLCLPPAEVLSVETDLPSLAGPEFGVGDQIKIGELQFSLAHSARTVAIPEVHSLEPGSATAGAGAAAGASQRRFFCSRCRVFIPHTEIKRLGLVGHAKHYLCPKCSSLLDLEPEPSKPLSGIRKWLRRAARSLIASSPAEH
jgi:hypothetical protein